MTLTIAKFATLVATPASDAVLYTEAIAMGENQNANVIPVCHYFNGPNTPTFTFTGQISTNGVDWADAGPAASYVSGGDLVAGSALPANSAVVEAPWLRFRLVYSVAGAGSNAGAICFDLVAYLFSK